MYVNIKRNFISNKKIFKFLAAIQNELFSYQKSYLLEILPRKKLISYNITFDNKQIIKKISYFVLKIIICNIHIPLVIHCTLHYIITN